MHHTKLLLCWGVFGGDVKKRSRVSASHQGGWHQVDAGTATDGEGERRRVVFCLHRQSPAWRALKNVTRKWGVVFPSQIFSDSSFFDCVKNRRTSVRVRENRPVRY